MKQEWRIRSLRTITQIKSQNPFLNSLTWFQFSDLESIDRRGDQVPRKKDLFGTVVRIYGDSYLSLSPKGLMTTYLDEGKGNNQIY